MVATIDIQLVHRGHHLRVDLLGGLGTTADDVDCRLEPAVGPFLAGECCGHLATAGVLDTDESEGRLGHTTRLVWCRLRVTMSSQ